MILKNSIAEQIIQKDLNKEQLSAAKNLNNAVVAAGAGSGKTRVISYRYAYLVCVCGYKPSEILTLTFTDKATTQMHEKIYEVLKIISESPEKDESIQRAEKALEEFQEARIQTLDSYASSIVKSQGRLYGISPNFSIDLDKAREFAQSKAIPFALKHRKDPNLQAFISTKNLEETIQGLFAELIIDHTSIVHKIDFQKQFENQKLIILEHYTKNINKFHTAFKDCNSLFLNIVKADETNETYKYLKKIFNTTEPIEFPSEKTMALFFEQNDENENTKTLEIIKESLFKTLDVFFRLIKLSKRQKEPYKEIAKISSDSRPLYEELTSIIEFILNAEASQKLGRLLDDFQNEFNIFKRTNLTLTYKDVSDLALEILTKDYATRESEKKRYKAIMIDEFQDNNDDQKNLLFLLAEKPKTEKEFQPTIPEKEELETQKLFFVGDEKQSIYRFRGADVRVFRKLQKIFDTSTKLKTNYRSHQSLISGFNSLFGGQDYPQTSDAFWDNQKDQNKLAFDNSAPSIFLKENHIIDNIEFPEYEALYEEVYARPLKDENKIPKDFLEPRIHFCFNIKKDEDENENSFEQNNDNQEIETEDLSNDEIEAFFTAQKIKEIVDESQGEINYSDIAILFRTYTKQNNFEKYLRSFGIPYTSESIRSFFNDAPVNDLLSILKLIIFPHDSISYASFYHSPFARLPLSTVHTCIHFVKKQNEKNKENQELFPQALFDSLNKEEQIQLEEAKLRFEKLEEISQTASVSELLSYLWYTEGYRYETIWNESVNLYTELYDFLFEIARKIDDKAGTLIDFVEYLSNIETEKTKLESMDIPLERPGAVRMMSIHKSKGLEFPIVFVCGIQNRGKNDTNDKEYYYDDEHGITFNFKKNTEIKDGKNNYFFLEGKTLNNFQANAELRRLLYVAMTRAEKKLYVTGFLSINKTERKSLEKIGYCEDDEASIKVANILQVKKSDKLKKKDEKKETILTNDFIDPDNTFFTFLYPIISHFMESQNTHLPFALEEIPSYTEEDFSRVKISSQTKLEDAQKEAKKIYEDIEIQNLPEPSNLYLSPSTFSSTEEEKNDFEAIIQGPENESFNKSVDEIIEKTGLEAKDFGTIAHAYLEAAIKDTPAEIPKSILSRINPTDEKALKEIGEKMCEDFFETPLGQKLKTTTWLESELAYIHLVENPQSNEYRLIKGNIDLAFKNQENEDYLIIDFKTDRAIEPNKHLNQLYFYKEALSKMKRIPSSSIRSYIFYLRHNKEIELTKDIETIHPNLFT